jgi:hypothetical protein
VGIAHAFDGEPVVIDTPNGPVKGLKGQNFYSFRGSVNLVKFLVAQPFKTNFCTIMCRAIAASQKIW